jgi:predicted lipoprotein with Yx(FWY)xxD motif
MHFSAPRRVLALAAIATLGALLLTWTAAASSSRPSSTRGPIVTVGSTAIGSLLIDTRGRTLYLYTPDKANTSACYGQCASFWPPLLTTSKAVGKHGVKQSLLGTTKRKDGKLQVTYAGHPLYSFAGDSESGDVNGQGLQNIWYAVSVNGARIQTAAPTETVALTKNDTLGASILTDSKGMSLYMFKRDSGTTSVCYGGCAAAWPALLLTSGPLRAGLGLKTSLLGTTGRTDGTVQVTYAGHPLYYFARDTKPGDTNGQGFATLWYVLSATGAQVGG